MKTVCLSSLQVNTSKLKSHGLQTSLQVYISYPFHLKSMDEACPQVTTPALSSYRYSALDSIITCCEPLLQLHGLPLQMWGGLNFGDWNVLPQSPLLFTKGECGVSNSTRIITLPTNTVVSPYLNYQSEQKMSFPQFQILAIGLQILLINFVCL